MDDQLKDLLGLLFQRADAMQTFWNFYAGAVTIVIGVVTAGKAEWLNRTACAGLSLAFVVFAAGNFASLDAVRRQREALAQIAMARIASTAPPKTADRPTQPAAPGPPPATAASPPEPQASLKKVVEAVKPPTLLELYLFHGALDAVTLGALWGIPAARRRHERVARVGGRG
jgi:hypothetical protein